MMKLIISTTLFYPSNLGGPANTLYWLAKAMACNGVKVSVVTTNNHIEEGNVCVDTWSDVDGIKVRYCKKGWFCLLKELCNTWKEMHGSDTVMLCDMFQRQVLSVAFMAKTCHKKIIWSPRGELFGPALGRSRIKRLYVSIVRKCFAKYATFHATSEEEKELILSHIGKDAKVVIIPNYIELPEQRVRQEQTSPYFLYVGRVNRIKALDRMVLGLAQSKLFMHSAYKLKIAGPDQNGYQQELQSLIDENGLHDKVEFLGNVFGNDKFQLYANAHFSCLLSHSENFGNVVIEALSQGTPVIASKGTPWQQLNGNHAGFWIDNSPGSIAGCIDAIMEQTVSEYKYMRFHARELANKYDVSQNIDKWIDMI